MAKNDNLKDFVTDIADTLRTLTQTSEPINPQDFTTKMHDIKEDLNAELNEQDTLLAELQSSVDELPNQVDLSSTTATADTVLEGKEFFNANGEKVAGTYKDMLQARIDATNSCEYLFYEYGGNNVDFIKDLDTSNVTTMRSAFYMANDLTTIPLINTSKVENFMYMFGSNGSTNNLTTIPQLDTSSGTDFSYMFPNCRLTEIPLLNTKNGRLFNNMFESCKRLTTIPQLNTISGIRFSRMFVQCSKLTEIPLLNTGNATDMEYMFYNCSALTTIPQLNTGKNIKFGYMFNGCSNLTAVPSLDTSSGTDFNYMFAYCRKLETIGGIDLINATKVINTINDCSVLTNLTLKNIKISLQIGSGTSYGHLLTDASIINTFQELWDLTGSTSQKLTLSTPSLARTDEIYVKLIDITDEMRAEDEYIDNKKPCVVCESTDVGAMTLKEYGISKNWTIA